MSDPAICELQLFGKYARGRVAIIDTVELPKASPYRWRVTEAIRPNGTRGNSYVVARGSSQLIRLHTLITGWPRVDHENGDGLDNRRANLREATSSQNAANRRKPGTYSSAFKGVHWDSRLGKWRAQINIARRTCHLGLFTDEIEAARAYDAAARETWGEFARLNFPKSAAI